VRSPASDPSIEVQVIVGMLVSVCPRVTVGKATTVAWYVKLVEPEASDNDGRVKTIVGSPASFT
jgi:hypothetical protein